MIQTLTLVVNSLASSFDLAFLGLSCYFMLLELDYFELKVFDINKLKLAPGFDQGALTTNKS